ncbi:MAG: scaffolding protein [Bacteriophage sp.]|nr:MAG: scaffolding protein [Bacteriophage sp.]
MSFLTAEEMQARLSELTSPDLEETRRVEIINELGQQHASGLQEQQALQETLTKTTENLNQSRDAMALMYSQLNAQNFGGTEGKTEDPSFQETVTIDDLLKGGK